jgi:tetratricopeptide (TPR) repeat protein
MIPGWSKSSGGSTSSSAPAKKASKGKGSSTDQTRKSTDDDVVAIAVHSGAEKAVMLKDLNQEQMGRVLNQNRNLGTAIDLIGVYLKNYEIDKADRLCARIQPLVRDRGGVWLFKFLNFYTTVRMKQSRYDEALEMYKEYETLVKYSPQEAWELYDTVYRNYGWIYTSLHEYEKALQYFEKAVEVKRANGIKAHWFDQWDLGKTHARISLRNGKPENLELAFQLICEGLEAHKRAEPQDTIMRCKMLNSAGECASILGDFTSDAQIQKDRYTRAVEIHKESLDLYMQVLGPGKPLTGWAMEDLAGALKRLSRHEEAKELLHGALAVECSKDIIKLPSVVRLLDAVLEAHRITADREGLARCQDAVNIGLSNLQRRCIDKTEAPSYAALLQKIANLLLAHDIENRENAISLLEEALSCLKVGGMRPEGMPRSGGDEPNEREEYIPHAGQQECEVNESELLIVLEEQITLLRNVCDCVDSGLWQNGDADVLPKPDPDAPFIPSASSAHSTSKDEGPQLPADSSTPETSASPGMVPVFFEVIDDEFPEVD